MGIFVLERSYKRGLTLQESAKLLPGRLQSSASFRERAHSGVWDTLAGPKLIELEPLSTPYESNLFFQWGCCVVSTHSDFPRCFTPRPAVRSLITLSFTEGGQINTLPLEGAGPPGSVVADEIMRNVWVCFTEAPRRDPCCNAVLFDRPLSAPRHQSSTGKLRA